VLQELIGDCRVCSGCAAAPAVAVIASNGVIVEIDCGGGGVVVSAMGTRRSPCLRLRDRGEIVSEVSLVFVGPMFGNKVANSLR
jgi:hypothetical protein